MIYGAPEDWGEWETTDEVSVDNRPLESVARLDTVFKPPVLATLLYPLGDVEGPAPSDLLLRRETVERAGGFEETFPGFYEDQAFLLKVYLREAVFVSSESWLRYRIHPDPAVR